MIRKSAYLRVFFLSVQIISGLDRQSKFKIITLFSGRHVSVPCTPTWRLHTGFCLFLCKIFGQIFEDRGNIQI